MGRMAVLEARVKVGVNARVDRLICPASNDAIATPRDLVPIAASYHPVMTTRYLVISTPRDCSRGPANLIFPSTQDRTVGAGDAVHLA